MFSWAPDRVFAAVPPTWESQETITVTNPFHFDTPKGVRPNIIPISGNVFAIAYGGTGDVGFLQTVQIAANGQIKDAVIDTLQFDTAHGKKPSVTLISGSVYVIAYEGDSTDGLLKTVEIAADGQITDTVIDTLEFDTLKGSTPTFIPISGNVYALAYTGEGNDGFLKTVEIATDGQITDSVIGTLEFDTLEGDNPNIIPISGNVYAITYAGELEDGFVKTVEIAANGQITNAVTAISINLPSGATDGDLLIAAVMHGSDAAVISAPGGWTSIANGGCDGSNCTLGVWYKVAVSETGPYSFTWSGTNGAAGAILRYSGANISEPIDVSGADTGTSSSTTAPNLTTTVAETTVLRFAGVGDSVLDLPTDVYPPGHVGRFAIEKSGELGLAAAETTHALAGPTGTAAFSLTSAAAWRAVTITIKPAVAAPPVNAAPTAFIASPAFYTKFQTTDSIKFSGLGDDPEDGNLIGDSLVWTSNIDGFIDTGESCTHSLSAGTHTITLTVTDDDGAVGDAIVMINVDAPASVGNGGKGEAATPTPTPPPTPDSKPDPTPISAPGPIEPGANTLMPPVSLSPATTSFDFDANFFDPGFIAE